MRTRQGDNRWTAFLCFCGAVVQDLPRRLAFAEPTREHRGAVRVDPGPIGLDRDIGRSLLGRAILAEQHEAEPPRPDVVPQLDQSWRRRVLRETAHGDWGFVGGEYDAHRDRHGVGREGDAATPVSLIDVVEKPFLSRVQTADARYRKWGTQVKSRARGYRRVDGMRDRGCHSRAGEGVTGAAATARTENAQ